MSTFTLSGRTAVVAGGSAGIGREIVDTFLARGMRVGVIARGEERLAALENEVREALPDAAEGDGRTRIATAAADVGDSAALEAAAARLAQAQGAPDVWVNCAMQTSFSPFAETTPEEIERILDTTLLGQINGCRAALARMERGRIVNVGSGLAYRSVPLQSAYCAAKHGINGFTAALRSELIAEGRDVTLSLVQLPAVDTPQFDWARNRLEDMPQPAPPVYAPRAAAQAVLRAVRHGPRELLVGASVLQLVLGQLVVPGWLDRKVADAGIRAQKSGEAEPGGRPDNMHAPVAYPPSATGRYSGERRERAVVLDGDRLRGAVFGGVPLALFLAGLAIG
jgi:NAD(P)-dependent dehydrogenase (short-subunit alcohol dehydrogenase family)